MITYINAYNCVADGEKSEVILSFFQNTPIFTEDGGIEGMSQERVHTVAMTALMAQKLHDSLESVLNNSESHNE